MNINEQRAINIFNKWFKNQTIEQRVKKLNEEYSEFLISLLTGSDMEILDEAGDLLYVLITILYMKFNSKNIEFDFDSLLKNATNKLESRGKEGMIYKEHRYLYDLIDELERLDIIKFLPSQKKNFIKNFIVDLNFKNLKNAIETR